MSGHLSPSMRETVCFRRTSMATSLTGLPSGYSNAAGDLLVIHGLNTLRTVKLRERLEQLQRDVEENIRN